MAEIEGKEHTLTGVFSNAFAFAIPLYQRPYRWEVQHAEDLLDDLLAAVLPDTAPIEKLDPYFLGSIVLVKTKQSPAAEVLDGQQRLTTLTLLLACLRAKVEPAFAEGLTVFLYEKGNPVTKTPDRHRLRLRERDQDFFEKYVLRDGGLAAIADAKAGTDGQLNLKRNAVRFLTRLEQLPEAMRQRLAQFMALNCFLVVVSTPDIVSAYRIFSVLNDRGLDLSHTDILKADVIGAIPDKDREKYTEKWEDLEESLKGEAFEQLFSQIRMIVMKTKLRASILKEFRDHVRPAAKPAQFVDETLLPLGDAYQALLAGDIEVEGDQASSDAVSHLIEWLRMIDHTEWEAPALQFLRKNRADGKALAKFFGGLERLAAALMIIRANRDARVSRYAGILKAMEDGSDLYAAASPLMLKNDEAGKVVAALDDAIYFTGTLAQVTQYVLLRLDRALASADAKYNHKTISIEHVLPQTPTAGGSWSKKFTPDEHAKYLNRLGNLVLLARRKNSQARSYDFADKKKKYFSTKGGVSAFALTTQVLTETDWTPAVVEKRQKALVQKLKDVWALSI